MNVHPAKLAEIRQKVAEVREALGDDEDERTLLDTLDGETDVLDIVGALLEERSKCAAYCKAMSDVAKEYDNRAAVWSRRADAIKATLAKIRDVAKEYDNRAAVWSRRADAIKATLAQIRDLVGANIKHPAGTVIVSERAPAVEYASDFSTDALPDDLIRVKREPDKKAINEAMAAGRNIPGVQWGNPKRTVTIR